MFHEPVGTERQLEGSASDVDHCRASGAEIEVGLGAPEAEPRFVVAVEHDDIHPGLELYLCEPFGGVRCLPHRARGDHPCAPRAKLLRERFHSAERFDGRISCFAAQLACLVDARAKAGRRFHFIDDADCSARRNVGDYLPNRVASDVDRGDSDISVAQRELILEMVLDLLSFCEVDGIFSDISSKVGHTLEISADEQQLE